MNLPAKTRNRLIWLAVSALLIAAALGFALR
jgi:hypothetical protein